MSVNIDPCLLTSRLRLRLVDERDAGPIQSAASEFEVADTMISIAHPYPEGESRRYIASMIAERASGQTVALTLEKRANEAFCGQVLLRYIDREHSQAELSFWLAPAAWGRGYMSEVLPSVIHFGFEELGLNRLYAFHMTRNPASGRVLEKSGFIREGTLRQRVFKWGRYEDVAAWAILRSDWQEG